MMAQLCLSKEAPYEAAKLLQKLDDGKVDADDEKPDGLVKLGFYLNMMKKPSLPLEQLN